MKEEHLLSSFGAFIHLVSMGISPSTKYDWLARIFPRVMIGSFEFPTSLVNGSCSFFSFLHLMKKMKCRNNNRDRIASGSRETLVIY